MKQMIGLAVASFMMAVTPLSASAGERMSQDQLRKLFPGSFQAVVHGLVTVKITARSNGVLIGQIKDRRDSGRWSLEDGKLCIMLSRWTNGRSSCSAVVADNGWYHGRGVKFRKL
jgi:hypothetical protein